MRTVHCHRAASLPLLASWFALVMVASGTARAGSDELLRELEALRIKFHLPALAGAAVRDGVIVESAVVGVRKYGAPELARLEDKWHIGSCTKSMTATVMAMFVEEGVLKWQTTVGEIFWDEARTMAPGWSDVTLEQLLAHRGGAPANPPPKLWEQARKRIGSPMEQRRRFVHGLLLEKPAAPPGTQFVYSNQGYAIAGAMLEKRTGKSWEDLVRTRLFKPLELSSAGFGAPATPRKIDQPWGHLGEGSNLEPVPPGPDADNPPAIGPAGTVHCSISDLARYAGWHARGAHAGRTLLTDESFTVLHRGFGGADYALGWGVARRDWAGGLALSHSGSNTMFYAVMWVAPERNAAFVAATNAAGTAAETACDQAVAGLIRRILKDR